MRIANLVVCLAGLTTYAQVNAALSSIPAELEAAVKAYDLAQIKGDREALITLLADDYLLVNGAGDVETKGQFIADSIDPSFKLDPFVVINPVTRVWSGAAVLAGEVFLTGSSGGKTFEAHTRFADIWAKRAGRWQVVFTQVTRMPKKSAATP